MADRWLGLGSCREEALRAWNSAEFDIDRSPDLIASSVRAGPVLVEVGNDDVSANKPRRCCSALLPSRSQLCSRLPTQWRRCALAALGAYEKDCQVERLTSLACCSRKRWLWQHWQRQRRQFQRRQALAQLTAGPLCCHLFGSFWICAPLPV